MSSVTKSPEDEALSATRWNTSLGVVGTVVTVLAAWWGSANPNWLLYVTVGEAVLLIVMYFVVVRFKATAIDLRSRVPGNVLDRELYVEFHDRAIKKLGTAVRELLGGHLRLFGDEVRQGQVSLVQHLQDSKKSDRTIYAIDLTADIPLIETRNDYFLQNETLIRSGGTIKRVFIVHEAEVTDPARARLLLRLINQHQSIGVEVGLQIRQMIRDPQLLQDFVVFGNSAVIVEGQQAGVQYEYGHSHVYFDQSHIEAYRKIFDTIWRGVVGPSSRMLARRFLVLADSIEDGGAAAITVHKLTRSDE